MLLLLLTLALLGSPACRADYQSEMYGSKMGTVFCTSQHHQEDIKGIRVSTSILGIIMNIQLKFGDTWDAVQGVPGGRSQELLLGPDEYITEVHGSFLLNLKHLTVCTNRPRCAFFGKRVGREFSAFPREEGQVLKGICGVHGLIGIKGISIKWGYGSYASVTPNLQGVPASGVPGWSSGNRQPSSGTGHSEWSLGNTQPISGTGHSEWSLGNTQPFSGTGHSEWSLGNTRPISGTGHSEWSLGNTRPFLGTGHSEWSLGNTQPISGTGHSDLSLGNTRPFSGTGHSDLSLGNTQPISGTGHSDLSLGNTQPFSGTGHSDLSLGNTQPFSGTGHSEWSLPETQLSPKTG